MSELKLLEEEFNELDRLHNKQLKKNKVTRELARRMIIFTMAFHNVLKSKTDITNEEFKILSRIRKKNSKWLKANKVDINE